MANQFTHLPLPLLFHGKPILFGYGSPTEQTMQNIINRERHGGYIKRQSAELSRFWKERKAIRQDDDLPEIKTGIPILLEIDPNADIEFLRGLGFEIVCEIEEGYIIVATEDIDLSKFNEKTDDFIENIKRRCNTPAKVYALCEDNDRLKKLLSPDLYFKWTSISDDEIYTVDIGVSCCGNIKLPDRPEPYNDETEEHFESREERWKERFCSAYMAWDEIKMERETTIETFVAGYNGEIMQFIDGTNNMMGLPDSFSARLKINGKCLRDLVLNFAYIFEIAESELINMGAFNANGNEIAETLIVEAPEPNSPIVCVIDSGIQENHKYLEPAIIHDDSTSLLPTNRETSDQVPYGGHGTRVAGAVLYPNTIPRQGNYKLPCWIRNMRVLNENNCMPQEMYPPKVIFTAVEEYHSKNVVKSKIFNHSIGSRKSCEMRHMTPWAAAIDYLSYKEDVLFIQASGNVPTNLIQSYLQAGYSYPNYLDRELCRISDPAQSLQALTIGSVSLSDFETDDLIDLGKEGEVSSFSRSGPGIWDVLKPEVVEFGGTHVLNKNGNHPLLTTPVEVCPELIRRSPEGPAFAKDEIGTSFSAPKVSYIAAQIEKVLPDSPALLYRALVAQSARWPEQRADRLNKAECISMLRHIGYGVPNLDRATHNDDYRITLLTPEVLELGVGEAHVFKVPIPEELSSVGEDFDILVEITLSYASKPRRTRRYVQSYLSTWLEWRCSRIGEDSDTFVRRIFETGSLIEDDGDFNWVIGDAINHGRADGFSRKNGTLQKDWCIIRSNQLSDAFCIAVIGHKGWGDLFKAKYSLTVSFEALHQDIEIYEPIKSMIEIETTIANQEIVEV